jgi:hypothetical protein
MIQAKTISRGPAVVAMSDVYYKSGIAADLEARVRKLAQNYPGRFTEAAGTNVANRADFVRRAIEACRSHLQQGQLREFER